MAPGKPTKQVKTGGKDIRLFFGDNSSAGQKAVPITVSKQEPKVKETIDISDDESQIKRQSKENTMQIDDDEDASPAPSRKNPRRRKIAALISSDEEEEKPSPRKRAAVAGPSTSTNGKVKESPKPVFSRNKPTKKKKVDDVDFLDEFDNTPSVESEYEDDEDVKVAKPRTNGKSTVKSIAKKGNNRQTSTADKNVSPAKEKAKEERKATKVNWAAIRAAKLAGPVAHGTKKVPDGSPDCLLGLSFVFTGELSSLSREEAIDLAKRYGGRVVLQPSSKTDFVVLGDNAGPSKLAAIKKHQIKTVSEDEFLSLIATRKGPGNGKVDDKTKKKMEKEQAQIKQAAKEMEQREQKPVHGKAVDQTTQLWTTRYAPQSLKEICGNKSQVEKLQQWLQDWPTSLKSGFKKPGKNGMNVFRAVLITGSPGIGKTTSAHLCAKLEGFTPIELNASDTRSKKLVENGMNINNTSLDGYVKGADDKNSLGIPITDKTCLIMDEVDGMSAGDRGGVGALNALIKKTKIPIICIANDRQAQKLRPLVSTTFNLTFQKPQVNSIRSRILSIAFKEKMKIPANVIDQLISGAQSDIRQVLNMLSTWKLSNNTMDFDEGKALAKMNEKYSIMTPFDITSKMLGPYLFSATSRETLNDKMEYYFQDHSFVPLFIQENYLKTQPSKIRDLNGPEKVLKQLEIMDSAASSISDADLVDALIHGPEQHWGLMPLHAVCSTVRPCSHLFGTGAHYGGPNSMTFPQWLGQNSKLNKLNRQLTDVQTRMRLKVSGDKSEIRQAYIPALFPHIIKPLMDQGASAVEDVIERMDEYYISKDDWETVVELGVGDNKDDIVLKKISTATKTSLTKKYNLSEHPIPFHKAQDLGKVPKKLAGGPAPDLEEAYIDDVIEEASDDESKSKSKDLDDISNDKLIQAPKKKVAANRAKKNI